MVRSIGRTVGAIVFLVLVAGVAGSMGAAAQSVEVDPSPSDAPPASGESTHTIVFEVDNAVPGGNLSRVDVTWGGGSGVDVSNVGPEDIERIGIDEGGDNVGTRIDKKETNITSVSSSGGTAEIYMAGTLTAPDAGDEVVLVMQGVQNPSAETKNASVTVTVNPTEPGPSASDQVDFEFNNANVTFEDQETDGSSVEVGSVNLSEGGFVVISNTSGADPEEVRGAKYLPPGSYRNVTVQLDEELTADRTLHAQVHLDSNGDQWFDYPSSNGSKDELYVNESGNIQTGNTEAGTATANFTSGGSDGGTSSDSSGEAPRISNYSVTADGDEITVTFDSDENLVDIEVDISGPEHATLDREDFSGDQYQGFEATYQAGTDGTYTLELVSAEDSGGNDGASDGEYSDTATADTGDATGTQTPTADGSSDGSDGTDGTPTPTDGTSGTDDTPTPTDGTSATTGTDTSDSTGGTDTSDSTGEVTPTPTDDAGPGGSTDTGDSTGIDGTETPGSSGWIGVAGTTGALVVLVVLAVLLGIILLGYRRRGEEQGE